MSKIRVRDRPVGVFLCYRSRTSDLLEVILGLPLKALTPAHVSALACAREAAAAALRCVSERKPRLAHDAGRGLRKVQVQALSLLLAVLPFAATGQRQPTGLRFKDPAGRVYRAGRRVLRGLGESAAAIVADLLRSPFYQRLVAGGDVVGSFGPTRPTRPAPSVGGRVPLRDRARAGAVHHLAIRAAVLDAPRRRAAAAPRARLALKGGARELPLLLPSSLDILSGEDLHK